MLRLGTLTRSVTQQQIGDAISYEVFVTRYNFCSTMDYNAERLRTQVQYFPRAMSELVLCRWICFLSDNLLFREVALKVPA